MTPNAPIPFPVRRSERISAADAAETGALAASLRDELFLAEDEPSYELLERATNGELSDDEAEALALRAEWDEELARELASLAALRDRIATGRRAAPRPNRVARVWRTAGLAAALLLAAIGVDRTIHR